MTGGRVQGDGGRVGSAAGRVESDGGLVQGGISVTAELNTLVALPKIDFLPDQGIIVL